jgi:hypothetical protein
MTADILAKIDGALTDYGYIDHGEVGSSMRWRPQPPEPEPEPEWHDLDGLEAWSPHAIALHYRVPRMGWDVHVRADGAPMMVETLKATYGNRRGWYPRPASHCEERNPHGNPTPLAVDGSEYQRRLRNRRKRGR